MATSGRQRAEHPNNSDTEAMLILGYDEGDAYASLAQQLTQQVEPTPETEPDDDRAEDQGGVIRRSNEFRSQLGPIMLESVGLAGMEIAKANERRARDLYRNKFPLLIPAFESKCPECGLEYDDPDIEACPECEVETVPPNDSERAWATEFFAEVNKEGQSLGELYQSLAKDAGRQGGWTHIVRYNYGVVNGAVMQKPIELVRADAKRIKPVVDEDHRIGGHWWACPIHRAEVRLHKDEYEATEGRCPECGAELREVFFAEVEQIGRQYGRGGDTTPEKVYFADEVIDFAAFNERLSGHDWLSPIEHLWKRQSILEWMNTYAGAFFDDQNTNRYPGRLLILHTSNRSTVEKQLKEAQDEREQDPYGSGVLYNEIPREGGGSGDQAQVIDLASEKIIGQSPEIKKDFKSDIRGVYGQVDVQDSELEDAGGLNNEGLQLTVRNDAIASWQAELRDGPLSKLCRVLDITDWEIRFVPPEAPEEEPAPEEVVNAVATAEQAGVSYEIADGRFMLADTDGVVDPEPDPEPEQDPEGGPGAGLDMAGDYREERTGLAREAVQRAIETLDPQEGVDGARWIGEQFDAMFESTDPEQQAAPVVRSDKQVPEFAQELLGDAVEGGAIHQPDELSQRQFRTMENVVQDSLMQSQGWSIDSVSRRLGPTMPEVEVEARRQYATNAIQNTVQAAIQLGYMVEGDLDERRFYLGGPERANTCEACESLLNRTNPSFGGEPVPLDEFRDLAENTAEQHDIGADMVSGGQIHINCIHRLTEHREARGGEE